MINVARVRFDLGRELYDYLNDIDDLQKGDKVVVETSMELKIAEVVEIAESSPYAHRFIIQKIDTESHKEKEEEIKKERMEAN